MSTQPIDQTETPAPGTYTTAPAGLTREELHAYRQGFNRGAARYIKANGGPGVVHGPAGAPVKGSAEWRMMRSTLAVQTSDYLAARHPVAHKAGMSSLKSYVRKYGTTARLAEIVDPLAPVKATRKPRAVKLAKPVSDGARDALAREAVDNSPAAVESRRAMFNGLGWSTTPAKPADVLAAGVESGHVEIVHVSGPVVHSDDSSVPVSVPVGSDEQRAHEVGLAYALDHSGDTMPTDYVAARAARKLARHELAGMMRAAGITPNGEPWTVAVRAAGITPAAVKS